MTAPASRGQRAALVDELCARHPDRRLLVDLRSGRTVTFGELPGLSGGLASALPVGSSRVLLRFRSPFLFTIAYLALFRCGATIIPVSPALPADALERITAVAHADCLLTDLPTAEPGCRVRRLTEADLRPGPGPVLPVPLDETGVVLFTSGTTGRPKGVRLSARSLIDNAGDVAAAAGINSSRLLGILPPHHTNGQVFNILIPLLTGSTVYVGGDYSLTALAGFWSVIAGHRIEYVDLVPTVMLTLLALPPEHPPDTSSLRYVICGAAPIPAETLAEFERRFAVRVLQEYGLTEATCVSAMETPQHRRPGTVGRPLPGTRIEIRDPAGRPLAPGERGAIWLRGGALMQGYVGDTGDTRGYGLPVVDGWLGTGDIGSFDQDGFLTISGRAKDVIIKGGENIQPEDVERVAHRHPGIADAAAVGRPDPFYGQVVELFVVWRNRHSDPTTEPAELADLLQAELPKAWLPARIHPVARIPRTPSGKILRDSLTAETDTDTDTDGPERPE